MEPKFQSSFIPKGPLATSATVAHTSGPHRSLFGFLSTVLLVITIVAGAGLYGYGIYLNSNITKLGADLASARVSLQPDAITEITNLNSRIASTQTILANHVVLSPVFNYLEASTLQSVGFTSFSYTTTPTGITIGMKGEAKGYDAVALQAQAFANNKYITNQTFTDLSLDDKGDVNFSFAATLDPAFVSYAKEIAGSAASSTPSVPVAPLVTASSTHPVANASSTATSASSSK